MLNSSMRTSVIDEIVKENSNISEYNKYSKRVKTYSELCSYINENISDINIYYNIDMKELKNHSLSVKYRDENKRICRIDSARDKVKIVTDRACMFSNLKCQKHTRSDFRTYYTITIDADEFFDTFTTICKNAKIAE